MTVCLAVVAGLAALLLREFLSEVRQLKDPTALESFLSVADYSKQRLLIEVFGLGCRKLVVEVEVHELEFV